MVVLLYFVQCHYCNSNSPYNHHSVLHTDGCSVPYFVQCHNCNSNIHHTDSPFWWFWILLSFIFSSVTTVIVIFHTDRHSVLQGMLMVVLPYFVQCTCHNCNYYSNCLYWWSLIVIFSSVTIVITILHTEGHSALSFPITLLLCFVQCHNFN